MGRVAVERKNVVVPPLEFLWQTIQQFNEAGGVVWLSGLVGFASGGASPTFGFSRSPSSRSSPH